MLVVNLTGEVTDAMFYGIENTNEGEKAVFKCVVYSVDQHKNKAIKIRLKAYDKLASECNSRIVKGTYVEVNGFLTSDYSERLKTDVYYVLVNDIVFKAPNSQRLTKMSKKAFLGLYKGNISIEEVCDIKEMLKENNDYEQYIDE